MIPNPLLDQSTPVDMLAETQKLYRWTAEELIRLINALHGGQSTDAKGAGLAMRDLLTALTLAINERNQLEKFGKTLAAAKGAATDGYNLDAARAEIGGRLARLRAARDDRGVFEQSE